MSRSGSGRAAFSALLSRAYRQWRRAADLRLQPYDLTEATWLPLLRISRAPIPLRQKDLASSLFVDNSSVVRLLDSLEAAGLVKRREGEDRRARIIVLTARGRAIADKVETVARKVRIDALAGLSDKDIETAIRVLEHVCRALDAAEEMA
ncbi:MAG: MarR family transcriptional regulator [Hyphomonadaceae bacterium]|jgi:MarR family transcriptional regulator, transcriptional regulator for hemolysin|nr:MarR family transcriptional regulator [Hyphomonadaceae bacterium]HLG48321.1 MarR family transcriptional regulator [Reyranella sp.]